ncbi:MAG: chloride channel protein [Fuerstiella sp.]|nr:chloride channel protein [Fuerstiella sp.]
MPREMIDHPGTVCDKPSHKFHDRFCVSELTATNELKRLHTIFMTIKRPGLGKSLSDLLCGRWLILSVLVGVFAGCSAIVFQVLTEAVSHYVLWYVSGFQAGGADGEYHLFEQHPADISLTAVLIVLVLGGLISGFCVYRFAPEAEGHGTDGAIDAFHNQRGTVSARVAIIKTLASALTLGSGGSGGREGPIAQIGASVGSCLGQFLKLSARDRRILLAAGMGAGVGAVFRAPMAGALFAGEILYRDADIESEVIVPSAIASIVAYSAYGLFLPGHLCFSHVFGILPEFEMQSIAELLPYSVLALALVGVGFLYTRCFREFNRIFSRLPGPQMIRPALGAGLAGLTAITLYLGHDGNEQTLAVLSTGYGLLQTALKSPAEISISMLLTVAAVKIVTTSLTISSGGSGGVFGPSMVIGGCVGVAIGQVTAMYWPHEIHPGAFGVVGMAGFFAGCAHAPISTIIMVSEMTGSYQLLLPAMWVSTLCFLMSQRWTLYDRQVRTRLESPAHRGDFLIDVLEGITVNDVYRQNRQIDTVSEAMPLASILKLLTRTHQHYFPVVNETGTMVGIFSTDDVRRYLYDESIWQLADAVDVMTSPFLSVAPTDDLNVAMKKFTALNLDELPVLSVESPGKLLGMLRRKETIAAYNQQLLERQQLAQEHA